MRNKRPSKSNARKLGMIIAFISLFGASSTGATIFLLAGIHSFYFEVISYGITLGGHIIALGGSILLIMRSRYGKAAVWIGAFILLVSGGLAFTYSIIGGMFSLLSAFLYFVIAKYVQI